MLMRFGYGLRFGDSKTLSGLFFDFPQSHKVSQKNLCGLCGFVGNLAYFITFSLFFLKNRSIFGA